MLGHVGGVAGGCWRCGRGLLEVWQGACWRCGRGLLEVWQGAVGGVAGGCWRCGRGLLEVWQGCSGACGTTKYQEETQKQCVGDESAMAGT